MVGFILNCELPAQVIQSSTNYLNNWMQYSKKLGQWPKRSIWILLGLKPPLSDQNPTS